MSERLLKHAGHIPKKAMPTGDVDRWLGANERHGCPMVYDVFFLWAYVFRPLTGSLVCARNLLNTGVEADLKAVEVIAWKGIEGQVICSSQDDKFRILQLGWPSHPQKWHLKLILTRNNPLKLEGLVTPGTTQCWCVHWQGATLWADCAVPGLGSFC